MISPEDFKTIAQAVKNRTKIEIIDSNVNSVKRYVKKQLSDSLSFDEYLDIINCDENEFNKLLQVVTINETYFFREEKYFTLLDKMILPDLKERGINPFLWSAATSTGEEAISLALLYNKHYSESFKKHPVIATDIDVLSMDRLRVNRYGKNSFRNDGAIFHDLIYQNSTINDNCCTINSNIMKLIEHKRINLITDSYNEKLLIKPSVILLCNVLIYMDSELREIIIDKAAKILDYGGYLIVSSANTAFINHPLLELVQRDNSFYFKKIAREDDDK